MDSKRDRFTDLGNGNVLRAFNDFVEREIYHRGKRKPPTAKQRKKSAAKRRMQKKSRR